MSGKISQSAKTVTHAQKSGIVSDHNSSGPAPLTVSVEDAGKLLGISRGSAYAQAKSGGIPTIRLGKRLLVPKAALERLLLGEQQPA
jgi:excisionase family DNA binding protein